MFAINYLASFFANPNPAPTPQQITIETTAMTEASHLDHIPTITAGKFPYCDRESIQIVPIPRENGFGDFCFDSVAMRNEKYERERENRRKDGSLDSMDRTTAECLRARGGVLRQQVMEDLIRLGTFPFMKLPIEIRERIYRWVAMPYNYDGEQQFDIRIQRFYAVNDFSGIFYGLGFNEHSWQMDNDIAELETRDEQQALYLRKRADFWRQYACHPERNSNYLFSTNVKEKNRVSRKTKKPTEEDKWVVEWKREVSVEMIRALSNVSSQVRNELGNVLWRNVHIECDDYCHEELVNFLIDRPAIHAGIKSLKIMIEIESEEPQNRNKNVANFHNFCDYLSATLILDTLHVHLHFNLEDVDQISRRKGKFSFLAALRNVVVTQAFNMSGMLYASSDWNGDYVKSVTRSSIKKIKNGLKPYSLLEKAPTTEQEGYLQERKALVHSFRKHERRMSRGRSVSV